VIKNYVAVQVLALATTHSDFHLLFIAESPSSQICFSGPLKADNSEVSSENIANCFVSYVCCVTLHCHTEAPHLSIDSFFPVSSLAGIETLFI